MRRKSGSWTFFCSTCYARSLDKCHDCYTTRYTYPMIPASHHGRFVGPNRLFLMPGTPVNLSVGVLVVSADRVTVSWAFEGEPKEGVLLLRGPSSSFCCDFTDTFHAATGLQLHGCLRGCEALLYGTFSTGDGAPDWGWRIVLDWSDPENFTLRMFTAKPDGTESLAVELQGARAAATTA